MWDTVELEIPPRVEFLALVRMLVVGAASNDPLLGPDRLDDLRLAVSEAATNAIEAHRAWAEGDPDRALAPVEVRCVLATDRVEVSISDRGRGFDPDSLPEQPAATDPARLSYERGLGVPLIRLLTDEVEFRSDDDGTTVRMVLRAYPPSVPGGGAGKP